jgi:flagellar hook-associated protein 1 FlgK
VASVKYKKLLSNNDITIDEFYAFFTGQLAADKRQADIFFNTKAMTVGQYSQKLEQVKGVSMEEEQTNLLMFQRVFEANSRYVNVIDQMLDTIVNGLGLAGRR